MTRDRFLELAEAYGGAVARWPAAEREAAATLMAAEPEFVRQSLAAADRLDAVLGAWAPLSVPHGLREAVIAAAPVARPRRGLRAWLLGAGVGAGLAGACAAGLVFGVALSGTLSAPTDAPEAVSAAMAGYDDLSETAEGA
ncbi:MAG: hypothetical protein KA085_08270 [Phenylobacterium sp.]|uniref:hypothetical protein n=1 Tax=Phenylobacterium sp. TaxID=1871053 RepID=UPI001B549E4F|nr:hypothetical protein [Phenylobacterium sp.]MBP7649179.1 hypothetical protein [Phenylobacterium sp.]MBP7816104.1 hypothetical protein [Phenylobacterium sp.]MBP9230668.1 hypothetical protein [Phenylobacterium sp.]MBP9753704.1 hypothetical protein [Phenylobacterium sp.]